MNILWVALHLVALFGCRKAEESETIPQTYATVKGISYVSPSSEVGAETFNEMRNVNGNYTAIIPFGFIRPGDPTVQFNLNWQWWGERSEGVTKLTQFAHQKGLSVMIKPQVWIGGGAFTGTYEPEDEAGWQTLEDSYRAYIMLFAKIAEAQKAELFCVGTEFKAFMKARPQYWGNLIDSVRSVYSGELTYAGNWDSYKDFPHWAKLDYIGVDAYFPLSDAATPTVAQLRNGWQGPKAEIRALQKAYDKPILFTEYGYRNIDFCAKEPWDSGDATSINMQAQINGYEAFYQEFWGEPWFAGAFLWKWHPNHSEAGGLDNNRFTPQNKPVEANIKDWYGR